MDHLLQYILAATLLVHLGTIAAATVGTPSLHTAQQESIEYMVYGYGRKLCRTYVQAREQGRAGQYLQLNYFRQWMAGYMSSYNRYHLKGTGAIAIKGDENAIEQALEVYCRKHPEINFALAAPVVIRELQGIEK